MTTTNNPPLPERDALVALLQAGIDDPMWPNHFEINKNTARRIIASLADDRAAAPDGFALVPLRMTRAMQAVFDDEGWEWRDLLAAAEAITEEEYDSECEDAAQPEPIAAEPVPMLVCPKCKADRFREPCKGNAFQCPMAGTASNAATPAPEVPADRAALISRIAEVLGGPNPGGTVFGPSLADSTARRIVDLLPAAAPAPAATGVHEPARIGHRVCNAVAELPDRNSPDDWPEAMLVTADELLTIVMNAIRETPPLAPAPAAGPALPVLQEPKYTVNGSAIVNRASGAAIPADEPVFVFRARDVHAREALEAYACVLTPGEHRDAVVQRLADFAAFSQAHPERMKEPDTDRLAPPAPSKASEPGTWKLVPVEPTEAMVQATHHLDLSYMPDQWGADRAAIYRAMIASAPEAPGTQGGERYRFIRDNACPVGGVLEVLTIDTPPSHLYGERMDGAIDTLMAGERLRPVAPEAPAQPVQGEAVTHAMRVAGAEAAREYMARTGGNSVEAIYLAMRAAAQPEQGEPVAWIDLEEWAAGTEPNECVSAREEDKPNDGNVMTALYTARSARKRVTEAEIAELVGNYFAEDWAQKKARGLLDDFAAHVGVELEGGGA